MSATTLGKGTGVGKAIKKEKVSKLTFDKKGDWSSMSAARWHDSMYYEGGYFYQLFQDTQEYTKAMARKYCGPPSTCVHVEVGSGTGDVLLSMAKDFKFNLGLDINREFLDYSAEKTTPHLKHKVKWVEGSATDLVDILNKTAPDMGKHPSVVSIVNNTIGVFPQEIKPRTYQQLMELAGSRGVIIVGFWNANVFGDAMQHFYAKHPQLCGSMKGANIDFETCTMTTTEGYITKWTSPTEARQVLEGFGFNVVDIKEIGAGVLCTCLGKGGEVNRAKAAASAAAANTSRGGSSSSSSSSSGSLQDLGMEGEVGGSQGDGVFRGPMVRRAAVVDTETEGDIVNHYDDSFSQYFYQELWGGLHKHIGLYEDPALMSLPPRQRVVEACDASIAKLFSKAAPRRGARIIEFGSGFGATARYAATHFATHVTCVDLSGQANAVNRRLCEDMGLSSLVEVGPPTSFFDTGCPSGSFDMVVSQDALTHAGDQTFRAVAEAARLLRPGGKLLLTTVVCDPQAEVEELEDVFPRLRLTHMESAESLIDMAQGYGLSPMEFEDTTASMTRHFSTVLELVKSGRSSLVANTSPGYAEELEEDLARWEQATVNGILRWGFLVMVKQGSGSS